MKRTGRQTLAVWLFMLILALTFTPIAASAGFVQTQVGVKYTTDAGETLTGLQKIGKKYYLFNEQGVMQTGIQKAGNNYYFFDTKTGARRGGWITYAGAKYFANRRTGVLFRNRKKGQKFYFGPDCALVKGGAPKTGWVRRGGKKYYYDQNNQKVTGFYKIGNRTYYFSKKGVMWKKRIVSDGTKRYYLGGKGYILRNRFITANGKKYYATGDGSFTTGIQNVKGSKYAFDADGVMLKKQFIEAGADKYYALKSGKIAANRWVKVKGKRYWADPDGTIATNRFIGNFYVGPDGVRIKANKPSSGIAAIGGHILAFTNDGKQVFSQWYSTSDGKRYYIGSDGTALTGLQIVGGYKYYFGADGVLQTDAVIYANGFCYYTSKNDGHIVSESARNGNAIVGYAKQFVGNPYVYGGTSLTRGADCSGFTQSVLSHFGIRIMRVAVDQMNGASGYYARLGYAGGYKISDSNLQPGDLVFYGYGSYASHVAIYMGNNRVVHAANSRIGIVITSIDYVSGRLHNQNRRYWA